MITNVLTGTFSGPGASGVTYGALQELEPCIFEEAGGHIIITIAVMQTPRSSLSSTFPTLVFL